MASPVEPFADLDLPQLFKPIRLVESPIRLAVRRHAQNVHSSIAICSVLLAKPVLGEGGSAELISHHTNVGEMNVLVKLTYAMDLLAPAQIWRSASLREGQVVPVAPPFVRRGTG
jgi:hypothetical protein